MASHLNPCQPDETDFYDVVIMGGALSGGATATLLLRQNPGIRILILEKSTKLSRRVSEATVEVSAYFMGRVLGLTAVPQRIAPRETGAAVLVHER
jgi:2-polyprenyl-6-methoxyphenol hydroxylase-like FAD-dependent oxidoreductase